MSRKMNEAYPKVVISVIKINNIVKSSFKLTVTSNIIFKTTNKRTVLSSSKTRARFVRLRVVG